MPIYMPHMDLLRSMMLPNPFYTDDSANDDSENTARLHKPHLAIWPDQPAGK